MGRGALRVRGGARRGAGDRGPGRPLSQPARPLQAAQGLSLRGRSAEERLWQDPEARAARSGGGERRGRTMILEMAHIEVKPGAEAAFEAAVAQAAPLFAAARGCQKMELHRVVEAPSRYILMVRWETLEDHTVH